MEPTGEESPQSQPPQGERADLVVNLEGFDGPIDLLLNLAKEQKVDLARLSILALAEQYLSYIASARKLRLEIAADYLVMAAWLAYLKSRLLIPDPPEEEPNAADMAEALKFQLLRLEAMQKASQNLFDLPQLGSDIFLRGAPERMAVEIKPQYYLPLYDLLSALGAPMRRRKPDSYDIKPTRLYSMEESMTRLRRLLGSLPEWGTMQAFLPSLEGHDSLESKSAVASTFSALLEMVKSGELDIRQDGCFAPIFMKKKNETPQPSHGETDERRES